MTIAALGVEVFVLLHINSSHSVLIDH